MINLRNQKFWAVILAVVMLAALFAVLFHHHEHGDHHEDCAVCRLVQQIISFTGFVLLSFFLLKIKAERFLETSKKIVSLLFIRDLSGRAPPQ